MNLLIFIVLMIFNLIIYWIILLISFNLIIFKFDFSPNFNSIF